MCCRVTPGSGCGCMDANGASLEHKTHQEVGWWFRETVMASDVNMGIATRFSAANAPFLKPDDGGMPWRFIGEGTWVG